MSYTTRTATQDELNLMMAWAAQEGWNPGLHDAAAFYAADPQGYFLGLLDDEPMACMSAVAYDARFGFLGFYIVKPEYRNQGYGLRLWQHALSHLPTQNIGLDGVVAQQDNYRKSGFQLAYRNIRYEGVGIGAPTNMPVDARHAPILPLSHVPFAQLLTYDAAVFPTTRAAFLREWLRHPDSLAVGYLSEGQLRGYGMIRPCRAGYKIGPLCADQPDIAAALLGRLRQWARPDQPVYLDTPETNRAAVRLAESAMMKPIFETARMYSRETPAMDLRKIYGVTTFELG